MGAEGLQQDSCSTNWNKVFLPLILLNSLTFAASCVYRSDASISFGKKKKKLHLATLNLVCWDFYYDLQRLPWHQVPAPHPRQVRKEHSSDWNLTALSPCQHTLSELLRPPGAHFHQQEKKVYFAKLFTVKIKTHVKRWQSRELNCLFFASIPLLSPKNLYVLLSWPFHFSAA